MFCSPPRRLLAPAMVAKDDSETLLAVDRFVYGVAMMLYGESLRRP